MTTTGYIQLGLFLSFIITALLILQVRCAMADSESRYERGYKQLKALDAIAADQVLKNLADVAPDMGRFLIEFAYGDIYTRPALDVKSRQLATIAILTALGNAQPQLKWHIGASLNIGITPEEIIDTIYVQTVYSGFPAGLNAIFAAKDVFKARNLVFKPVRWDNDNVDRRARGLKILDETSKGAGQKVIDSMADIAPDMADFLINFSYGTVFCRNILSPQLKEIIAITSMAATGTMKPQLKVHIKAGLNVGLTKQQIIEAMMHVAVYAGFPAALNGIYVAREVFVEQK